MPGKNVALGLVALLAVAGGFGFRTLDERVSRAFAGEGGGRVRLHSAPFRLRPGIDLAATGFRARLLRLGYRESADGEIVPGTFRAGADAIEIGLRGFSDGELTQPAMQLRIDLDGEGVRALTRMPEAQDLAEAWLEPEPLGLFGEGALDAIRPVRLESLPPHVVQAVLAAEDVRFSSHPGIDAIGIVRAAWTNLRAGGIEQGGSTITQQLVKNMMLDAQRTWGRKAEEAFLAMVIDFRFTKEEILQAYLDSVYMGRIGPIGMRGLAQGARGFFGKEPEELSVPEAATLAGLIRAPNTHSPIRHPGRARERRDQVLGLMAKQGWLDPEQLAAATNEPLQIRPSEPIDAPFFVDEATRRLAALAIDTSRTLDVFTSLDVELQRAVEESVANELAALEKNVPAIAKSPQPLEAAAVVIEARTGRVLAMVGGRDRTKSQFDHATRARRQPGSAFKPFVYLAAVDAVDGGLGPSSLIADAPLQVRSNGAVWRPRNSDGRYVGRLTVRRALEQSRNIPAYHVAQHVGLARVREVATTAGLGDLPDVPSLALGTGEVTPLDLTAAYTVFPNLGEFVPPSFLRTVQDGDGAIVYRADPAHRRVAGASATYVVSHLLEGVVDRGTARDVRRLGLDEPLAGKTGTTDDSRDAWFVGYSPDFVVGVWVGFDDGRSLGVSAARAAVPMWVSIMRHVLRESVHPEFRVPDGVVFREVDRQSGLLATASCRGDAIQEAFLPGTEPTRTCESVESRSASRQTARNDGDDFLDKVGGFFRGLFGAD